MRLEAELIHRHVSATNLPYISNQSPTATTPYIVSGAAAPPAYFVSGSQDLMTGMNGYCERRPGFAEFVESGTPTTFNNLQRLFTWDRFDGTFIEMACDINASSQSVVYKRVVGLDANFVSIFTDTATNMAFDFVVSNNTVYFSNGNVAKKWDPVNGVSNWGISIGLMSSSIGPDLAGSGADVAVSPSYPWSNPGNITVQDSQYATVILGNFTSTSMGPNPVTSYSGWSGQSYTATSNMLSPALSATGLGFSIPSNATIVGIQATITRYSGPPIATGTVSDNTVALLNNSGVSNRSTGSTWSNSPSPSPVAYGGSTDTWGVSWTPAQINSSSFGVELIATMSPSGSPDLITANVANVQVQVWYTYYAASSSSLLSDYLQGTGFNATLNVPSTNTVNGILVEIDGYQSTTQGSLNVQLLKGGNLVGSAKTGQMLPSTSGAILLGGASDLWGTTWLPNDFNQSSFGVSIQAVNNPNYIPEFYVDAVKVTVYGVGGPGAGVITGPGITAATGYQYVFCFGNSATGHISSPTLPSNVITPNNQNMTLQLTGSSETQVNQIRVFRSTDSVEAGTKAGVYYELPTSPYPNISVVSTAVSGSSPQTLTVTTTTNVLSATQPYGNHQLSVNQQVILNGLTTKTYLNGKTLTVASAPNGHTFTVTSGFTSSNYSTTTDTGTVGQQITDEATDLSLNVSSIAPTAGYNDPPTPFHSPVYFSGRIWGFRNSTQNQVFFSALEECVNGVPEESFPSGPAGNYWNFDEPVQALAVAGMATNQVLLIFCGGRIYTITGNSLDTFRNSLLSSRRGCRNLTTAASMNGVVGWLDTAGQVWTTDGNSMQEISTPIRPDLVNIVPSDCSLTFHGAGKYNWLVLSTGSQLFVYDLDLQQWMPPWSFACNYIFSGETAPGNYQLMAAGALSSGAATKALMLSTTAHNDDGNVYTPIARTNLFAVVPDFSQNPNAATLGIYDQPSKTGYPAVIEVDTNNVSLADVSYLHDDDPTNADASYTSIFSNQKDPAIAYNRSNGLNLVQNVFPVTQPNARWIGLQFKGETADDDLKIYEWFMAYKELRVFGKDGM